MARYTLTGARARQPLVIHRKHISIARLGVAGRGCEGHGAHEDEVASGPVSPASPVDEEKGEATCGGRHEVAPAELDAEAGDYTAHGMASQAKQFCTALYCAQDLYVCQYYNKVCTRGSRSLGSMYARLYSMLI